MFSRGRSLKASQAGGALPRRPAPRRPGRDLPTERPPRPASLSFLSIKPSKTWGLFDHFHPTYAMAFLWVLVGQGLIATVEMPFSWRLPLGFGASLPIPWALFYIPALIIGGLFLTFGERFHGGAKAYFAGAGAYAGIWTLIAQIFGFYSAQVAVACAVGWLIFTSTYSWMRHTQQVAEDVWWNWRYPIKQAAETAQTYEEIAQQRALTDAERWEHTFAKVYGYNKRKVKDPQTGAVREIATPIVRYVDRIDYPESGNVTVQMRLPETGLTFKEFAGEQKLEFLERVLRQADKSIRVEMVPGEDGRESSRDVWMHLDIVDVLSKMVEMEKDHTPISCYEAFKIGKFSDGTWIFLTLSEIHSMIIGVTGAGKTNLLHVIVWQLSRCYDAVIIGMDFKGGAFLRPWLAPWAEKKTDRPIFYHVAVELATGYAILQALLALCKYRGKMVGRKGHGSKWKASRTHPAVFCLIDELSEAAGTHAYQRAETPDGPTTAKAAKLYTRILILGRGVGVWTIAGVQRNTVDMTGSGTGNSQVRLRIGMQVTNPSDAGRIFGYKSPAAARMLGRLVHDGSALVQTGKFGSRVIPSKICFFGDDDAVLQNAEERCLYIQDHEHTGKDGPAPRLDAGSAAAMEEFIGPAGSWWEDAEIVGWIFEKPDDDDDDDDDPDLRPTGRGGGTATRTKPPMPTTAQPSTERRSLMDDWTARRAASADREAARREALRRTEAPTAAFEEMTQRLASDQGFADAWEQALNADYSPGAVTDDDGAATNSTSTDTASTVGQDATRDASDVGETTVARGVRVVVEECRKAGERGCTATDIRFALVREGVLTSGGTTAYSRIVKAAMALATDFVHQPVPRGRYFFARYGTGRTE